MYDQNGNLLPPNQNYSQDDMFQNGQQNLNRLSKWASATHLTQQQQPPQGQTQTNSDAVSKLAEAVAQKLRTQQQQQQQQQQQHLPPQAHTDGASGYQYPPYYGGGTPTPQYYPGFAPFQPQPPMPVYNPHIYQQGQYYHQEYFMPPQQFYAGYAAPPEVKQKKKKSSSKPKVAKEEPKKKEKSLKKSDKSSKGTKKGKAKKLQTPEESEESESESEAEEQISSSSEEVEEIEVKPKKEKPRYRQRKPKIVHEPSKPLSIITSIQQLGPLGSFVGISLQSKAYPLIKQYFENSCCPNNSRFDVNIHSVFQLPQPLLLFAPAKPPPQISEIPPLFTLLWSKTTPEDVSVLATKNSGGLPFYDRSCRALAQPFSDIKKPLRQILLLVSVHLGKVEKSKDGFQHWKAKGKAGLKQGFDSVKCVGRYIADFEDSRELDSTRIIIPCGKTLENNASFYSSLKYNEYVVFEPSRIRVQYAVDVEITPKKIK